MRHFHRTTLPPADVLGQADAFFTALGLAPQGAGTARDRSFAGALGALRLSVRMEGGHYTFVQVNTDQMGESRLDRNVKKFFVGLHRRAEPRHVPEAAY